MEELSPDILVLDIEMPGLSGIDVARQLCEARSAVHILVFSEHDDKYLVKEMLANGVDGYLTKEEPPESVIDAIRGIARGERGWISRRIVAQMSFYPQDDRDHIQDLTEREIQVLQEVIEGQTNLEIGLALDISEKTVEKHLNRIFSKLSVGSRLEAAVQTLRNDPVWSTRKNSQEHQSMALRSSLSVYPPNLRPRRPGRYILKDEIFNRPQV